jgi:transposase
LQARGIEITPEIRAKIALDRAKGLSACFIAQKYGIHRNSVYRTIKRLRNYDTFETLPRPGRPKATTYADDRKIVGLSIGNRKLTAPMIQAAYNEEANTNVGLTTIKRRQRTAGLIGRIAAKKTLLRRAN